MLCIGGAHQKEPKQYAPFVADRNGGRWRCGQWIFGLRFVHKKPPFQWHWHANRGTATARNWSSARRENHPQSCQSEGRIEFGFGAVSISNVSVLLQGNYNTYIHIVLVVRIPTATSVVAACIILFALCRHRFVPIWTVKDFPILSLKWMPCCGKA